MYKGIQEEDILYEDGQMIVCVKMAGKAVQTKKAGEPDLYSELMNYRALKGEKPYIAIVHRLDQPVEGVMVFAKTKEAAADLNKQMQNGGFGKYYLAVAEGELNESCAELCDYLLKDGKTNTSKVVSETTAGAKQAKLSYEVLDRRENRILLRIKLETGRHHQIRVQMAHAGCPLCGDYKYGNKDTVPAAGETRGKVLALCSCRLGFRHPVTGKILEYRIEPKGAAFTEFF